MFRHQIIFTALLSLKAALASSDERPVATILYDDEKLTEMRHQIELLNKANENLRLHMENNNERMDRRPAEISNEIKSGLSGISNEMSIRLDGLANETNSRLSGLANEIHSLSGFANDSNSGLKRISNEITEIKISNLSAKNCTNSSNEKGKKGAYPTNCLKLAGGVHRIQVDGFSPDPFYVYCDNVTQDGGWTVVQRRMDGSVDFDRNWADYKHGLGDLAGEFFIGLEKLHALTMTSVHELLIVMRDKVGVERFAKYEAFAIGSENECYVLKVLGEYSGDAGDDLSGLKSARFYTKDNDSPDICVEKFAGAWWQKGVLRQSDERSPARCRGGAKHSCKADSTLLNDAVWHSVKVRKDLSTPFNMERDFRQGDSLACDFFNMLNAK